MTPERWIVHQQPDQISSVLTDQVRYCDVVQRCNLFRRVDAQLSFAKLDLAVSSLGSVELESNILL